MELLRNFLHQMKHISLITEQEEGLERVLKTALRVNESSKNESYEKACESLNIEDLITRRTKLCLQFAQKCLTNKQMKTLFPKNSKKAIIKTRHQEKFKVKFARTERLKKSSIPYMQRLLNNQSRM